MQTETDREFFFSFLNESAFNADPYSWLDEQYSPEDAQRARNYIKVRAIKAFSHDLFREWEASLTPEQIELRKEIEKQRNLLGLINSAEQGYAFSAKKLFRHAYLLDEHEQSIPPELKKFKRERERAVLNGNPKDASKNLGLQARGIGTGKRYAGFNDMRDLLLAGIIHRLLTPGESPDRLASGLEADIEEEHRLVSPEWFSSRKKDRPPLSKSTIYNAYKKHEQEFIESDERRQIKRPGDATLDDKNTKDAISFLVACYKRMDEEYQRIDKPIDP